MSSLRILALDTGDVARAAMLGYMLTALADGTGAEWRVRAAGTHADEGSTLDAFAQQALLGIDELGQLDFGTHRSHRLGLAHLEWADVVLASEAANVDFVRARFPEYDAKVVQFHQFVRYAPLDEPFEVQLASVVVLEPDPRLDVRDPHGGDAAVYRACADDLWELAQVFATVVGGEDDL